MFLVACYVVEDSLPNQEHALASSEPGMEDAQEKVLSFPHLLLHHFPPMMGLRVLNSENTGFIWATLYSIRCENLVKT